MKTRQDKTTVHSDVPGAWPGPSGQTRTISLSSLTCLPASRCMCNVARYHFQSSVFRQLVRFRPLQNVIEVLALFLRLEFGKRLVPQPALTIDFDVRGTHELLSKHI
jgi:hypothetical protein